MIISYLLAAVKTIYESNKILEIIELINAIKYCVYN